MAKQIRKPNPSIPEEIMYDILLMLPVKTLSRFKSVCKSWLSLISGHDFIQTHLTKSTNDPHFTSHHLNISESMDSSFITCSVYSLLNKPEVTNPVEIDHPKQISDPLYIDVIGYSNGLVCLAVDSDEGCDIFLWNPCTRTSRRLPECDIEDLEDSWYHFCYDESNNDFKVFANLLTETGLMLVYSSKHDSWRVLKNFHFNGMYGVVFANRALHCVVSPLLEEDSDDSNVRLIISFDKNMKRHRKVLQPNYGEGADCWTLISSYFFYRNSTLYIN